MMGCVRDYQPQKNNQYLLPYSLYRKTLAFIRDYERMRLEYTHIGQESPPPPDGMPRGSSSGNPTERNGIRRAELHDSIKAIEDALDMLPEEYRKGVWRNIIEYKRYPKDADVRTYSRYKQRFIYHVAHNLFWI